MIVGVRRLQACPSEVSDILARVTVNGIPVDARWFVRSKWELNVIRTCFHAQLLLLAVAVAPAAGAVDPHRAAMAYFENQVRPILFQRCYECHGEAKQKGGLRADHISHLKAGGKNGPAVVPGEPGQSALIEAVRYGNPDLQMPPEARLPDAEIAILEKWVRIGAPWPDSDKVVETGKGFTRKQRDYWFFQPVATVSPPEAGGSWARNDIDRFIARNLEESGLTPAPEAGRRELARRAYFDLHGLPPSVKQMNAFLQDEDPKAYEKLWTICSRARATGNAGRSIGSTWCVMPKAMVTTRTPIARPSGVIVTT